MTTLTAPAPTIEYITTTERLCPACTTPMERHGLAWICPRQRAEEKRVSQAARASAQAMAAARVDGCEF